MKLSPAIFSFSRRAAFWLAGLLGAGVLVFACLAAGMYFWLLPNISSYRDTVAVLMSSALGQRVTLEAVSGKWQQARPEISLRGVRLFDQQNRPALYLEQLEASFAWRSLLFLEPRFNRLELAGSALAVRRARDGHYYVGGIPINPADPNSDFSDWLLKQGTVHVSRATLAWQDEVRGAPALILRDVDFTLENLFHRHQAQLRATPPADLATPVAFEADLTGRSLRDIKTWSGHIQGSLAGVEIPKLSNWIDLPYPIDRGWGAANVRLDVAKGLITGISAGLNVRDVSATLGVSLPPLQFARLRGSLGWQQLGAKQRVEVNGLSLTLPGGSAIGAFDASFGWEGKTREGQARNLDLAVVQSLLPALPVPQAVRQTTLDLQPQGRIDELQLRWQGEQPGDAGFDVTSRFTGLKLAAGGARPGVLNLSGSLRGDEKSGVVELRGKSMVLDLPTVFRESRLPLDSLLARGGWKKRSHGTLFTLDQADFANADAAGSAHGSFETVSGHAGVIDLTAKLTRGKGTAVYRYMPKTIGDQTVNWVKRAIIAGVSNDTTLTLKGDLERFPFANDQGGVFKVAVQVEGAVLDYVEGWPRIEGADAQLLFHGKSMEVHSDQARIFNARLEQVKAVISDLEVDDEIIEISGLARGAAQDFIRFANFSPVGEILDGLTDEMDGNGNLALALNMKIPLRRAHDATLAGRLDFRGNTLFPAGLPRLDQVKGGIGFTENSLTPQGLSAQFLGGPLNINASTHEGRATIMVQGRATAAGLTPWIGKAWGERLFGEADWRGELELGRRLGRIHIESDLVGLESRLPMPLTKFASQPLALSMTGQPQADGGTLLEVQLGRTLGATWQTAAESRFQRGEIRFGGVAKLPQEPGLRLVGSGRGLNLSEWWTILASREEETGLSLASIDLSLGNLELMGRGFSDIHIQGRTRGGLLRAAVSGREMSGILTYRAPSASSAGANPARLSAQFKHLTIPEAALTTDNLVGGINLKAVNFPTLDLTVEDFRLEENALGRLETVAHGSPQGLVIDKLQLTHADSALRMSGLWHDAARSETRAELQLDVTDAGRMLSRFGFKDMVGGGRAEIRGDVVWEGSPADFSFRSLAGTLNFKAKSGQFLKVNPGAGKLLGVLSLQSLPRRLALDFRDIFSDGYAFDEISATMRIARGVVYSDDFRMKGPAAKVSMSGLANLTDETVQLRVKVIPKLSEGVAVAGALLGGPIVGLGALAAQKMLRDPLEEASSQEFMVIGPWQEPSATRLAKPKINQDNIRDSDG